MNKKLIAALTIAGLTANFVAVNAGEVCYERYNGTEFCETVNPGELNVDKKIYNPKVSDYVNNIDKEEYTFDVDDTLVFEITVKNPSDEDKHVEDIEVEDMLPDYLETTTGADGYSFDIDELEPGEEHSKRLEFVVKEDSIPAGTTVCMTNIVNAEGDNFDNDTVENTDFTNFCVSRDTEEVETTVVSDTRVEYVTLENNSSTTVEVENPTTLPVTGGADFTKLFVLAGTLSLAIATLIRKTR